MLNPTASATVNPFRKHAAQRGPTILRGTVLLPLIRRVCGIDSLRLRIENVDRKLAGLMGMHGETLAASGEFLRSVLECRYARRRDYGDLLQAGIHSLPIALDHSCHPKRRDTSLGPMCRRPTADR